MVMGWWAAMKIDDLMLWQQLWFQQSTRRGFGEPAPHITSSTCWGPPKPGLRKPLRRNTAESFEPLRDSSSSIQLKMLGGDVPSRKR